MSEGETGQVTVGPRVEFRVGFYPRLRVWHSEEQRDVFLYLHRLTAYAHGYIDDLWAEVDIHHDDCDPWNNRPANLEPLERERHAQREPHVGNLR